MRSGKRTAFTLIELLVVLAIIGTLIALLLPAVQRVRDAGARIKCANNLRQIALAAHNYHDTLGSLPAGMRYRNGRDPYLLMSWLTQLLPFAEQDSLWRATQAAYGQSPWPLNNPPHVGLTTVLPVFVCPSDGRANGVEEAQREHIFVALTSYLGVEGKDLTTLDGVLFRDSRIRLTDITDGTSQTLLAGERPPSADFQFGWWYAGAGQLFTGSCDMILGVQEKNMLPDSINVCPRCAGGP
jgi:prepilin-type N-terminal cleavage/methylation domain-containing protein